MEGGGGQEGVYLVRRMTRQVLKLKGHRSAPRRSCQVVSSHSTLSEKSWHLLAAVRSPEQTDQSCNAESEKRRRMRLIVSRAPLL